MSESAFYRVSSFKEQSRTRLNYAEHEAELKASKALPMVKCELEAADSGFDAVLTVLDFSDQGSSHGPCNSDAGPKTSHFFT